MGWTVNAKDLLKWTLNDGTLMSMKYSRNPMRGPSDCRSSPPPQKFANVCSVCFIVDIFKGPLQIDEAHAAYISKVKAIENMHYTIGHISPEKMQHLVENGQWSWNHTSKPTNFVRVLPSCSYCALTKAKLSRFRVRITIPNQIRGLFFADVQGPF